MGGKNIIIFVFYKRWFARGDRCVGGFRPLRTALDSALHCAAPLVADDHDDLHPEGLHRELQAASAAP